MKYHKPWLNKSYFGLWLFLHSEVMKLACLMHIELLFSSSLGPGSAIHPSTHIVRRYFPIWPPFLPLSFTAEPCPRLFPMVLCFCRCLWQDLISDAVYSRTGFSLTSLKPKASMKEPFVTKILVDFLFSEISGSEKLQMCSFPWIWWFSGSLLCLTKGPKANQNPSFTWCSDLRVTANQVIFHTFRKKHVASIHD